jgi:hypothetical protein
MPNWKNENDYAYTTSLTPAGWAFEFLRRNKEYQKDYNRLKEANAKLILKYGPLNEATKEKWQTDLLFWHHVPDRHEGESDSEWYGAWPN